MRFATTLLATSVVVLTSWGARAEPSWIGLFIAAHGGCATDRTLQDAMSGRHNMGWQPFGRDPADWTDKDVVDLRTELDRCRQNAEEVGDNSTIHYVHDQIGILLSEIPPLVDTAHQKQALARQALEARKSMADTRIASADSQTRNLDAMTEEVEHLERKALEAEATAKARQDELDRRAAAARARTAQAQAVPQDVAPTDTTPSVAAPGFAVPSGTTLLPRLLGNGQAALKPRQTQTKLVNNVRTTTYLLGPSTVVAISEDAATEVVQNFGVYLAGSGSSELGVGLYVLMNAIDVVNPGLDQNGRDDILEPMVDAVVKNNTTYDVKLTHAQMHCRPIDGRALCAFGQIER